MPETVEIYTFSIHGFAETEPAPGEQPYIAALDNDVPGSPDNEPAYRREDRIASVAVHNLNQNAGELATDLEKEISRVLRGFVSVQAELRFYEGSFLIEGTVLIVSWLGPIALAAGKRVVEAELSKIVEVATRRVLQRALRQLAPGAAPVQQLSVNPATIPEPEPPVAAQPATPPPPASEPQRSPEQPQSPDTSAMGWADRYIGLPTLIFLNTVLLLLLIIVQIAALVERAP